MSNTAEFQILDCLSAQFRNLAHSSNPVSLLSEEEVNDLRCCKHCGGSRKEHGAYGTFDHVPDMEKPLEGYQIATAFCQKFEPVLTL